ncbi:MAG TPA: ComF family protein [Candidatus Binatia bacterium]|jgi:competence protein ComFC|nr:ComF family protein [Candidatus Binatia bacterium]
MSTLLESCKDWLNAGLGFLYPEVCQLCGEARATPGECFICEDCKAQVHFIERPFCERCGYPYEGAITVDFECANCRGAELHFCSARSAVVARGPMLDLIHRYKYQRAFWLEPFLAELLVSRAGPELGREKWDWIVPVPLHPTKHRAREFNQAERLALRLSAALRIPLNAQLLRRVLPTRTQTLLSREERLANVSGAFARRAGPRLNGERIVLVDDVFTTGATTGACARVLRAAGAGDVCVWTVARGI